MNALAYNFGGSVGLVVKFAWGTSRRWVLKHGVRLILDAAVQCWALKMTRLISLQLAVVFRCV